MDATTGNALLLSRPRPRPPFLPPPPPGLGPQAPDPRTRVAAVTDWGDPSAGHCPWPSPRPLHIKALRIQSEYKRNRGPHYQARTTPFRWHPQSIRAPIKLHTQGRLLPTTTTAENPKTSPGGCSGDSISQAAGARPHNNFETLGQGYRDLHRDPQK